MQDNRGSNTIPFSQFTQILQDVDPMLRDNDLPFLSKMYTNGSEVMYIKFMDDFN